MKVVQSVVRLKSLYFGFFFFSSRRRHTRCGRDWSSDVCSSDLGEALALLPERERLVFELRHDQGMRLAAIAEILETSDQTIRNCLYRAHQRLRVALADLGDVAARAPSGGTSAGERKTRLARRPEPLNG